MIGRVILVKEFLNSLFLTQFLTHFLMRIIGIIIIKKTIYFQNISTRSWFSRCFDIIW